MPYDDQPFGSLAPSMMLPPRNPNMSASQLFMGMMAPHLSDPTTFGSLAPPSMEANAAGKAPEVSADPRMQGAAADIGSLLSAAIPFGGPAAGGAKLAVPALAAAMKVGRRAARVGEEAAAPIAGIGHNRPPPDVTGNLNPLANERVTFQGKEPGQMAPEEMQAFGQHYGVENLGPLSPLQTFKDVKGKEFQVPGGTEGNWTYSDLLHMKANPINPSEIDRPLHAELQRKLGRTMTPDKLSDSDVWNGLVFGMTSPNNPLFPNQMAASRLRLRTPEMLDDLASMIPWKAGDEVPAAARKLANDQIASRFGLDAGSKGGLGVRGTADYSRVAEMAQLFKQNPEFFRKAPDESWTQAVERISSQLPGLSMKTGSFGTVWQDPANAAISAIDRHMARELDQRGGIFANPKERTDWENRAVALWNKRKTADATKTTEKGKATEPDLAQNFDDLKAKKGSDGFMGEMLLDHVGKALTPQFRTAKGEINPNIPQHLAETKFVREPETVFKVGKAYKQALDVNQKIANENGLNLFMSQWMEWDRIRNRFEPHENMFPGLSKLPAPSIEQLQAIDVAHKQTGHKTYGKSDEGFLKPTRPYAGNPSQMGLLGLGGAAVLPGILSNEKGAR